MASMRENSESGRSAMLAPVAALTRFRPDTSDLGNRVSEQTAYVRQGVKVGDTGLLLPHLDKVEIIELASVCPIPNTPMWFLGMINNRGNLLPVFNLKLFLAMDEDQPARWLMILGQDARTAGLCIDTLPLVIDNPRPVDIDWSDTQMGVPRALRPHVTGMFRQNDRMWLDMAYDKLFLEFCAGF